MKDFENEKNVNENEIDAQIDTEIDKEADTQANAKKDAEPTPEQDESSSSSSDSKDDGDNASDGKEGEEGEEIFEGTLSVQDEPAPAPTKTQKLVKEVVSWVVCIAIAVVVALVLRNYVFTMVKVDGNSMNPTLSHNERLFTRIIGYTPKRGDIIIFHPQHSPKISYVKRVIATEGDCVQIDAGGNVLLMKKGTNEWTKLDEPYISCQTVEGISYDMINYFENQNGDAIKMESDGDVYFRQKGTEEWEMISIKIKPEADGLYLKAEDAENWEKVDLSVNSIISAYIGDITSEAVLVEDDHIFVMGDNRSLGGSFDSRKSQVGQVHLDSVLGKASFRWWPLSEFGGLD